MTTKNPFIEPENFFDGYDESIRELKNRPEQIEFDKLCFQVLAVSDDGRKLMEMFKERFIMGSTPCPLNGPYETACVYYEGYRDAFRQLIATVNSYQQRKDQEALDAKFENEDVPQ